MSKINLDASVRAYFNLPETATDAEVHQAMQASKDQKGANDEKAKATEGSVKETSQEQANGTEQEPTTAELLISLVDKSTAPILTAITAIATRLDALESNPGASHTDGEAEADEVSTEELKSWQKDPINVRAKTASTRKSFLPSKRAKQTK